MLLSINCINVKTIKDGRVNSYKTFCIFTNCRNTLRPYLWYIFQPFATHASYYFTENIRVCSRQQSIEHYVKRSLFAGHGINPKPFVQAFYPLSTDIKNHVGIAKCALEMSKFDQENLHLKIQNWQQDSPTPLHYFRHIVLTMSKNELPVRVKYGFVCVEYIYTIYYMCNAIYKFSCIQEPSTRIVLQKIRISLKNLEPCPIA